MLKIFSIVSIVVFLIGALASWYVAGALVAPTTENIDIPDVDLPFEDIKVKSKSGSTLAGWLIESPRHKGVVLLFHGVRASRMAMLNRAKMLYDEGYSSILVDFQAHGESPGENITLGYLEKFDVNTMIDFARSRYPGIPIALIGVSLGGASVVLASPQNIDAIILESVYSNIETAVHNRVSGILGPLSWLPAEILLQQLKPRLGISVSELSPITMIKKINSPVYIISGRDDHHTTEDEAKCLFDNANGPKKLWLVEGLAHVDIFDASPTEYKKNVLSFLRENLVELMPKEKLR